MGAIFEFIYKISFKIFFIFFIVLLNSTVWLKGLTYSCVSNDLDQLDTFKTYMTNLKLLKHKKLTENLE